MRKRIGFLIPSANPTVEQEMYQLAPEGVSVHFQRMVARGPVGTLANLQARAASHLERMDETVEMIACVKPDVIVLAHTDRKSTRLNSSHQIISYAVFCLKKKKQLIGMSISLGLARCWVCVGSGPHRCGGRGCRGIGECTELWSFGCSYMPWYPRCH